MIYVNGNFGIEISQGNNVGHMGNNREGIFSYFGNKRKTITLSALGLIPDSSAHAVSNSTILQNDIGINKTIVVDGIYHLNGEIPITSKLIVEGNSPQSKLIVTGNIFRVTSSLNKISLKNIIFESSDILARVIYCTQSIFINNIEIRGCQFRNRIRAIDWVPPHTNPDVTKYGYGNLMFKSNICNNLLGSFVILNDIPFENCKLLDNIVTNFSYVFWAIANNNDNPHKSAIVAKMKDLYVERNVMTTTDDWWHVGTAGVYYSFIIAETQLVKYLHNHMEGMKTLDSMATYDAYLSCNNVEYAYNTWKNNICFSPSKVNNTLVKCKGGSGVRNYHHNNFIVEKEFAERFSQNPLLLRVTLLSITSNTDRVEIKDNLFNVYYMIGSASGYPIREMHLERNTMSLHVATEDVMILKNADMGSFVGYEDRFVDNIITATADKNDLITTRPFGLIRNTNVDGIIFRDKLTFEGNTISTKTMTIMTADLRYKEASFQYNTVTVPLPTDGGVNTSGSLSLASVIHDWVSKFNVWNMAGSLFREFRSSVRIIDQDDIMHVNSYDAHSGTRAGILVDSDPVQDYTVRKQYDVTYNGQDYSFYHDYRIFRVDGLTYVEYLTEGDVLKTIRTNLTGVNENVKVVGAMLNGTMKIKALSSDGNINFYPFSAPSGVKVTRLRTFNI